MKGCKGHGRESEEYDWGNMKEREGVCWRCGQENHTAKNCIADMPEDVKQKVLDHTHVAKVDLDEATSVSFSFVADRGDDPPSAFVTYGLGKCGKWKPGCPHRWVGKKGIREFAW